MMKFRIFILVLEEIGIRHHITITNRGRDQVLADYDILIRNGVIFDGLRTPRFVSDIGIVEGKIATIGRPHVRRNRDDLNVECGDIVGRGRALGLTDQFEPRLDVGSHVFLDLVAEFAILAKEPKRRVQGF